MKLISEIYVGQKESRQEKGWWDWEKDISQSEKKKRKKIIHGKIFQNIALFQRNCDIHVLIQCHRQRRRSFREYLSLPIIDLK